MCASTFDLYPNSLPEFKSLNQSILNLSPSSSRFSSISLSEKIYEISYFFEDKEITTLLETSSSLGINNLLVLGTTTLLVSENPENKRIVSNKNIVSKLFIPRNIKDKPISNYKLVVQVFRIINYYLRLILVDSQLIEISNNLSTIHFKRRTLGLNLNSLIDYHIVNNYHQPTMLQLKVCKIHDYSCWV